jgi:transketolase
MALAESILAAHFNQPDYPLVNHFTYVLASDGDLMEGVSHEVASLAGHLGLGKLIVFYDDNHISIDGNTELAYSDNVPMRFTAYGWQVQSVDGHDLQAIEVAVRAAQAETGRPSLIACRTHIGYKSPKQDSAKVHGSPLNEDDLKKTKEAYNWDPEAKFFIPETLNGYFQGVKQAGEERQAVWEKLLAGYRSAFPELAKEWDYFVRGELPAGWEQALPTMPIEKPPATRVASGKVLDAIAPYLPTLIGGSADLTPSNNTLPKDTKVISRGDFNGKYIHYGVREHGMGAIMNGLALHGLRPYGGTFLIFSDYMRPTIRLAAMMGLPVVYVFTHDSIGLGEDGPTHQPVEHLTALRAIPNLVVVRPADGNETIAAWKLALQRKRAPTALILTRQDLPLVAPADDSLLRGGYVLVESGSETPDVTLIGTGSEVHIALKARELLAAEGIHARVVSLPSWELFDAQPESYRQSVLPPGVPRVAVEAGVSLAWGHYLDGASGAVVGLNRFGASAPYKTLYSEFGLTPENVAEKAKKVVALEKV